MNCLLSQEQIQQAFLSAEPLIGRREKFWNERSWIEKLLFWRRCTIHDPELMKKIMQHIEQQGNFLNTILPYATWPKDIGIAVGFEAWRELKKDKDETP